MNLAKCNSADVAGVRYVPLCCIQVQEGYASAMHSPRFALVVSQAAWISIVR